MNGIEKHWRIAIVPVWMSANASYFYRWVQKECKNVCKTVFAQFFQFLNLTLSKCALSQNIYNHKYYYYWAIFQIKYLHFWFYDDREFWCTEQCSQRLDDNFTPITMHTVLLVNIFFTNTNQIISKTYHYKLSKY